ncbi:ATP-binding protein [Cohnella candidum]|nr:ATP-binding protein [Cohnella candidum]
MEKHPRKLPSVSLIILAGAIVILVDQGVLMALHVNKWVNVWGLVRTSAIVAFFGFLSRKVYVQAIQRSEQLRITGTLAASIAHEIRNPLTSLRGFIQLNKTDPKAAYTDIMLTEIDRINDIVNELLILAKPQKGEYVIRELRPLLQSVFTLINPQAILHDVHLMDGYPGELESLTIVCVESKLKQVFINVIKNSVEAMSDGGEITITVTADEEWVSIVIADNGPGFPLEQLDRIGQPFNSTKEKGTGLGLMICQTIVEDHGGTIHFQNQPVGGAVVTVKLPIHR